jgi:hypothetical protein
MSAKPERANHDLKPDCWDCGHVTVLDAAAQAAILAELQRPGQYRVVDCGRCHQLLPFCPARLPAAAAEAKPRDSRARS